MAEESVIYLLKDACSKDEVSIIKFSIGDSNRLSATSRNSINRSISTDSIAYHYQSFLVRNNNNNKCNKNNNSNNNSNCYHNGNSNGNNENNSNYNYFNNRLKEEWLETVSVAESTYQTSWVVNNQSTRCMCCNSKFDYFLLWKHHCRLCGNLVCFSCSTNRITLPMLYECGGSRVCDYCYVQYHDSNMSVHYDMIYESPSKKPNHNAICYNNNQGNSYTNNYVTTNGNNDNYYYNYNDDNNLLPIDGNCFDIMIDDGDNDDYSISTIGNSTVVSTNTHNNNGYSYGNYNYGNNHLVIGINNDNYKNIIDDQIKKNIRINPMMNPLFREQISRRSLKAQLLMEKQVKKQLQQYEQSKKRQSNLLSSCRRTMQTLERIAASTKTKRITSPDISTNNMESNRVQAIRVGRSPVEKIPHTQFTPETPSINKEFAKKQLEDNQNNVNVLSSPNTWEHILQDVRDNVIWEADSVLESTPGSSMCDPCSPIMSDSPIPIANYSNKINVINTINNNNVHADATTIDNSSRKLVLIDENEGLCDIITPTTTPMQREAVNNKFWNQNDFRHNQLSKAIPTNDKVKSENNNIQPTDVNKENDAIVTNSCRSIQTSTSRSNSTESTGIIIGSPLRVRKGSLDLLKNNKISKSYHGTEEDNFREVLQKNRQARALRPSNQ